MTMGVEERVAMANLRRVSGRKCYILLTLTCKRKRREDELEAERRQVLRVFCSLSRVKMTEPTLNSVTATVTQTA